MTEREYICPLCGEGSGVYHACTAGDFIAGVDGVPVSEAIREAIAAHLQARRDDPAFKERLRERMDADRNILDRLMSRRLSPCPSTTIAVLGMVGPPAEVRCGLLEAHDGPHRMAIEWKDQP